MALPGNHIIVYIVKLYRLNQDQICYLTNYYFFFNSILCSVFFSLYPMVSIIVSGFLLVASIVRQKNCKNFGESCLANISSFRSPSEKTATWENKLNTIWIPDILLKESFQLWTAAVSIQLGPDEGFLWCKIEQCDLVLAKTDLVWCAWVGGSVWGKGEGCKFHCMKSMK